VIPISVVPWVRPELTGLAISNSQFQFQFDGLPGVNYYVYEATNLSAPVTWKSLGAVLGGLGEAGLRSFNVPCTTNDSRFYRVMGQ
jgi:hypothetical protein